MNCNEGLMRLRRKKLIFEGSWHLWAGKYHPHLKNCLTQISKDSRSLFARHPDICFNIINKVVKQDFKMTKIWVKFFLKSPS